jgi:hypothetical protein
MCTTRSPPLVELRYFGGLTIEETGETNSSCPLRAQSGRVPPSVDTCQRPLDTSEKGRT